MKIPVYMPYPLPSCEGKCLFDLVFSKWEVANEFKFETDQGAVGWNKLYFSIEMEARR